MSSAKHFFLKFTERDRPTVKPTETSRGRSSFSQLRDKGTLCVRETVLLGRKEVVSIVDRALSPGPQKSKKTERGKSEGGVHACMGLLGRKHINIINTIININIITIIIIIIPVIVEEFLSIYRFLYISAL